jgi:hypothetical protein
MPAHLRAVKTSGENSSKRKGSLHAQPMYGGNVTRFDSDSGSSWKLNFRSFVKGLHQL